MTPNMSALILRACNFLMGMAAALTSVTAARYWRMASEVPIDVGPGEQSGEHATQQDARIFALMEAYWKSADLNRRAAKWSALAALLVGIATFLSIFV